MPRQAGQTAALMDTRTAKIKILNWDIIGIQTVRPSPPRRGQFSHGSVLEEGSVRLSPKIAGASVIPCWRGSAAS